MMPSISWDPVVDPPATIAIIGAGPVGIETAIYARFLGYHVSIFEQRRVGHRMLDWHQRPLAVPASECTTPLGHAAIVAQNPEHMYTRSDHMYTGKSYAEEYLLPLAKTDLLFDDIHFLSPIVNVSRMRTRLDDAIDLQERCNDEFRLLVDGRHRGPWVARADVVIDCRGDDGAMMGIGPGGGLAIGEQEHRNAFLHHAPLDRKFEPKMVLGKHVVLVGEDLRACLFVEGYLQTIAPCPAPNTRLTWLVHPDPEARSKRVIDTVHLIEKHTPSAEHPSLHVVEAIGVEKLSQLESQEYMLTLLKNDDSTVDLPCDAVASAVPRRYAPLGTELRGEGRRWLASIDDQASCDDFFTQEPGMYVLSGGTLADGAGAGLKQAFEKIQRLFAVIADRQDLDLYAIIEAQNRPT